MLVIAYQEVYHSVHHPGGVGLARVHTRREYNGLADGDVDRVGQEVRHDQHVDVVAGEGLAQHGLADLVLVLVSAHLVDEATLVRVGEWVAVREEHCVVVV